MEHIDYNCKSKQANCLNLIRLLAALQVMYGHIVEHLDIDMPQFLTGFLSLFPGVPVFFVLSGFLCWNSVGNSKNYFSFLKKRFWRIYPELWMGVFVELVCILAFADKLDLKSTLLFIFGQATIFQFWTPDSLRWFGCGTPNGSLWTICVLLQFYIVIWLIYKLLYRRPVLSWIGVLVACIFLSLGAAKLRFVLPAILYKLLSQTLIPYLFIFVLGCFLAEYKDMVLIVVKKFWPATFGLLLLLGYMGIDVPTFKYGLLYTLFISFTAIGFAYSVPQIELPVDISYPLYIYHMIVVNVMIMLKWKGNIFSFWIATVFSIMVAFISTETIGKLSKRMKKNETNVFDGR